ncbi:MAG: M23 family metallopeptidase [bacterium]|nr:M23 family metallopeptidase [bacterium]
MATPRPLLCAVLALAAGVAPCARATPEPEAPELRVEIRAREIAPGEPLRIDVASDLPLRELSAKLLERPVHFVRVAGADSELWSGWSMVELAEPPGTTRLRVRGVSEAGLDVEATHDVEIRKREFPEENLEVKKKFVDPPAKVQERIARERRELQAVYAARSDAVGWDRPFVRPVPGDPTSIFGTRRLFNGQPRSPHPGLDLRAGNGTAVAASGSGTVVVAKGLYYAGNTVILDHGGGLFTIYAHLSTIDVQPGETVEAGTRVGLSGATGRVTGPHLHWGAKIGNLPFDPRALLDDRLFP